MIRKGILGTGNSTDRFFDQPMGLCDRPSIPPATYQIKNRKLDSVRASYFPRTPSTSDRLYNRVTTKPKYKIPSTWFDTGECRFVVVFTKLIDVATGNRFSTDVCLDDLSA